MQRGLHIMSRRRWDLKRHCNPIRHDWTVNVESCDSRDTLPVRVSTCTAWWTHASLLLCLINAHVSCAAEKNACVYNTDVRYTNKQHTYCGHNACVSEACISEAQWGWFTVRARWSVSLITDVLFASRRIQRSHIAAHLRCANQQLRFCINIPTLLCWGCLCYIRWISCCWKRYMKTAATWHTAGQIRISGLDRE